MNLVDDQSQRKSNVADFDDQAYIQLQSQHLGGRGGDDGKYTRMARKRRPAGKALEYMYLMGESLSTWTWGKA